MHRINPQRLQRFDFAQRPRRAEFDDIRRADARQHQHRRQQRAEFAHDDDDHRIAKKIGLAGFGQHGNGLPDDDKSQSQRDENKQRHQRRTRTGNLRPHLRLHHAARDGKLFNHDPKRDERERAQPLNGEQREK